MLEKYSWLPVAEAGYKKEKKKERRIQNRIPKIHRISSFVPALMQKKESSDSEVARLQ